MTSDGAPNAVIASPGATILVSASAGRTDYCPGCIRQVYLGIGGYDPPPSPDPNAPPGPTPTRIGPYCGVSGGLPPAPAGANFAVPMTVPSEPGVYYIRATTTLDYFCVGPGLGPPENSVGRIVVRQPVTAAIEMWNDGAVWPSLPPKQADPYGPDPLTLAGRTQLTGLSEGDRVVLRAKLPAGATGRVEFVTNPPNVLLVSGGQPSPSICAATGPLCIAGEARVLTDAVGAITTPFTVTAQYVDPTGLELPDPADVTSPYDTKTYTVRYAATPPSNSLADVKILAPAKVTVTTSTMPVQMGSDFTLTAEVLSVDSALNLNGSGGTVQFKAGANNIGNPVAVGSDGKASITWRAGINPPACSPTPCGGFPFDTKDDGARASTYSDIYAVYTTGGASLLENACAPTAPATKPSSPNCPLANVDIDPAASSVTITSVTPGNPTAGQAITVVATVTGVPDFPPTGGTVTITASGGAEPSDNGSIGNAAVTETSPGVFEATITFTTGVDSDQMDTPGNYTLTASFAGTSALDTSTSADYAVAVGKEVASVVLTLPGGSPMAAGATNSAHVVITASNNGFLDNNSATVDLLDGTTVLMSHNLTNGESGTFDFPLSGVAVGTYSLTARYNGNSYYEGATSSPPIPLEVTKSDATITLSNLTRTSDVAPNGTDSVGDQYSIKGSVNPGGTPSAAGGNVTLKATILGVTTDLGSGTLNANGEYTFAFNTNSGVLLTTDAISLSMSFDGNGALNAGSTATTTSLTLAKANATVSVDVPSSVTIGSTVSVTWSVSAPASIPVTCPADDAGTTTVDESLCVEVRAGGATGTLITNIAANGTISPLATNGTSGSCLDSTTTTPPCNIYLHYGGNALVNSANGNDNVSINKATPTISVVATDTTIGSDSAVSVTISDLPSGVSPDCTGCVDVSVLGSSGSVSVYSNLDWPTAATFTLPTGSGAPATSCLRSAGTCRVTVSYDGNAKVSSDSDSDSFTINKVTSTVALTLSPSSVAAGTAVTASATVVLGNGGDPSCTNCLEFRLGSTTGTLIATASVANDGSASASLPTGGSNALDVGSRTVYAVYQETSTVAGSSDSDSVTVTEIDVSVAISSSASSYARNTDITIDVTITPGTAPGTICLRYVGQTSCLQSKTVSSGSMTLTWNSPNSAGTHDLEVHYSTTNNDYGSPVDSNTLTITLT